MKLSRFLCCCCGDPSDDSEAAPLQGPPVTGLNNPPHAQPVDQVSASASTPQTGDDEASRCGAVRALQCIVCDVDRWRPSVEQWDAAVRCISDPVVAERIQRYHKGYPSPLLFPRHSHPDTKCFAAGRLLSQLVVATATRAVLDEAMIHAPGTSSTNSPDLPPSVNRQQSGAAALILRTREGKPYAADPALLGRGWNFNMSHGGSVVVLGWGACGGIIGVDVMPVELVPLPPASEQVFDPSTGLMVVNASLLSNFFSDFDTYFTPREWAWITKGCGASSAVAPPRVQLTRFYVVWTLKESYIKAIGIGLGFELHRAEFTFLRAQRSASMEPHEADVVDPDFFLPVEASIGSGESLLASRGDTNNLRSTPPPLLHFQPFVSLAIDGVPQHTRWRFALFSLRTRGAGGEHVMAAALGPSHEASVCSYGEVVQASPSALAGDARVPENRGPVLLRLSECLIEAELACFQ